MHKIAIGMTLVKWHNTKKWCRSIDNEDPSGYISGNHLSKSQSVKNIRTSLQIELSALYNQIKVDKCIWVLRLNNLLFQKKNWSNKKGALLYSLAPTPMDKNSESRVKLPGCVRIFNIFQPGIKTRKFRKFRDLMPG